LWLWICLTLGETLKSPNFRTQKFKPCYRSTRFSTRLHCQAHKQYKYRPVMQYTNLYFSFYIYGYMLQHYCRVSLFDWRSYLNRKEIGPPSAFESMKVVNTTFYAWEIQILNLLNRSRIENIIQAELNYEERWHVLFLNKRPYRIVWFYAEPCRAEKPVQEDKKNILWTELVTGCLAAHLIHNVEKWWQKPSKII
jgi:hypothetical protein